MDSASKAWRGSKEVTQAGRGLRIHRNAARFVDLSQSKSTQGHKRRGFIYWLVANKILEEPWTVRHRNEHGSLQRQYSDHQIFSGADSAIRAIRKGALDPFESANKAIDYITKRGLSNNSILGYRYVICEFLQYSRLGLYRHDLNIGVKKLQKVWARWNRTPTRDEVRSMLLNSDLRMRTLISMLISTGARIGEIVSIRKDQINLDKLPVEVHLKANKVYRNRINFFCSETVMLYKEYLKSRKVDSTFVFPGSRRSTHEPLSDRPLTIASAWQYFSKLRNRLGMTGKYDKTHFFYRPGVFRILNLDILKSGGYPPDWAEYLAGHSISFRASYLPSTTSLAKAWLKQEHNFCFLPATAPEAANEPTIREPMIKPSTDPSVTSKPSEYLPEVVSLPTTKWRTKNFDYVKTTVSSIDYDQAIADGFSIFDSSPAGLRVFRKRFRGGKQWMKSHNRMLVPKAADFKDHAKPM